MASYRVASQVRMEWLVGLLGVLLGALLTAWRDRATFEREERRRLNDARRAAYAAWLTDMELVLADRAASKESDPATLRRLDLRLRELHLLESDREALALMADVRRGLPMPQDAVQLDLMRAAIRSDGVWPPFHDKLHELIAHVRGDLAPPPRWWRL